MTERPHRPTTDPRRGRHRTMLLGWTVGLIATLAVLLRLGRHHPGTPPLTRPGELGEWGAALEPVDAAAALCRLLAIALVGYLLAITVVQVLLALRPAGRRPGPIERAGPRFLAVLTAALVTSTGPALAGEDGGPENPAVRPGLGATMELIETTAPTGATLPETSLPWAGRDPDPTPEVAAPPLADEWVVRPGDHLWGIAAEVIERANGAEPDDRAVHGYWVRLIDANRDRLVDPENPDLILAGQRLRLP